MSVTYLVRASDIRLYAYCPRLYFFETHLGVKRPPRVMLRIILGRLIHLVQGFIARLRGYRVEEALEVRLGRVTIRGRPDYYIGRGSIGIVVELKSGRGPQGSAWFSDLMQIATYSLILARMGYTNIVGVVRYRNSTYSFRVNEKHISTLLKIVDEVNLVKYHGIVPYPLRSYRKCSSCAYKFECFLLDKDLDVNVEEPGSWIKDAHKLIT